MITIEIPGLDKVTDKFDRLDQDIKRELRLALAKSLRDIKARADHTHRYKSRTGKLEREGLDIEIGKNGPLTGSIFDSGRVSYLMPVHEGSRPHVIRPRNKTVLRWPKGGGFVFAKEVRHPGTAPDQFLYNAAESMRGQVVNNFRTAIADALKG